MRPGGGGSFRSTRFARGARALLLEVKAAAEAGLKNYFRYSAWLVTDIVTTPAWLVLLVTPILLFLPRERWSDPLTLNFIFWGFILWDVVSAGLWSFGMAIRREQQAGTLEFLMLTNASRAVLFSRNLYPRSLGLALSLVYVYAFFRAIFGVEVLLLNPLGVAVVLLAGMAASLGFGLVYGALVFNFKNVGPLNNILQFVLLGLSGVFLPLTLYPEPLRTAALASPFTYVADLLRFYAMGAQTVLDPAAEWLALALYTAALLLAGTASLSLVERRLKKTGGLGAY
uniref:ABC transporter permease n=1 Tax=Thermofilum pendens TaxID=2269 RepID=A0A7C4BA27_THEPE